MRSTRRFLRRPRRRLRSFVRGKSARDQVMLYTTAGGPACVLSATDDVSAALRAIANLRQAGGAADVAALAGMVYADVHSAYQSLAPRKCLFFCTDTAQLLSNPALLAGLAGDATAGLNMAVRAFATGPESALASALAGMSGGNACGNRSRRPGDALREAQASLANVLEFKTELAASFAGERLDTLTVAVPSLGTAVQASATVYMGHKLTAPAVETVTLTGRDTLTLTFNQAVGNADSARRYRLAQRRYLGLVAGHTLGRFERGRPHRYPDRRPALRRGLYLAAARGCKPDHPGQPQRQRCCRDLHGQRLPA